MKLLFLNNYHYRRGGSESVFFGEMELLRRRGHQVHSFARRTERDVASELGRFFPPDLKTETVRFSPASLRTVREVIYSRSARTALRALLGEFRPRVAHAHNIYGRLTTSVLDLLHREKIPTVLTLHDYKLLCPSYRFLRRGDVCEACWGGRFHNAVRYRCHKNSLAASSVYALESWLNHRLGRYRKNVDLFITPSLFMKRKMIEFGWPEKRVAYLPNFLHTEAFEPCFEPGTYFLYLGRLSAEKGIATLIRAFRDLQDPAAALVIAGEGPLRTELEELAAGDDRISFTGYLSGKELKEVIRRSLALVAPSEWYENAPISILEAFALGKPVIGADIGGIPEMVEDGTVGRLFEPGNRVDLASRLEAMRHSEADTERMGRAARALVESKFSPETHCAGLEEIYRRIV